MKIKGKVINRESKPEPFAKVFVSNRDGILTPKKIGSVTDENGNFTLDIANRDGEYLSASVVGAKTITAINEEINEYLLDLGTDKTQAIKEVTITGKKPVVKPVVTNTPTSDINKADIGIDTSKLKKKIKIGLIILLAIVLIGGTIYVVKKTK